MSLRRSGGILHRFNLIPRGGSTSSNPSTVGQAVTYTATVTAVDGQRVALEAPIGAGMSGLLAGIRLAEAGVPFMLHIGGGGNPIPRVFHENGNQVTKVKTMRVMALMRRPTRMI